MRSNGILLYEQSTEKIGNSRIWHPPEKNYESCRNFEIKAQPNDKSKSPTPFYILKKFDHNAMHIRGSWSISKRSFDIEGSVDDIFM